jgi:hypothetical protein
VLLEDAISDATAVEQVGTALEHSEFVSFDINLDHSRRCHPAKDRIESGRLDRGPPARRELRARHDSGKPSVLVEAGARLEGNPSRPVRQGDLLEYDLWSSPAARVRPEFLEEFVMRFERPDNAARIDGPRERRRHTAKVRTDVGRNLARICKT